MLRWIDVIKFVNNGNPMPDRRVERSEAEWKTLLTPEQYRITREKGTEPAYSSSLCDLFEPGKYACIGCGTLLFDSANKYQSGTGWPSFHQPEKDNVIAYFKDTGFGMHRVEAVCNTCDAHLGHVFPDGPEPSGLRYCINAAALTKIESSEQKATFGGGCFWCTEAIFQQLKGVIQVNSGYSGGSAKNPTYREVCSGLTGHAEVVEVTYDIDQISFEDLITIHLTTHNPCTKNQQGADIGTQYRSIVFYRTEEEKEQINKAITNIQKLLDDEIVTEVEPFKAFYKAESNHQDYYASNPNKPYCRVVIHPKLTKLKKNYRDKIKE